MAAVSNMNKTSVPLVKYYIYNPTYGPKEGEEHKKILYYYPPDTNIDIQIRDIGLCEAIVKFTETFGARQPMESMHTQKTRQLFYEAEPDFWLVMSIMIPVSQREKENQVVLDYHEDDVQDTVYQSILTQSYDMFRLFMGTFVNILQESNVSQLKQTLEHFYSRYLSNLSLSHADILDVFSGIHFLPLDKNMFLRIQCFVNLLESKFAGRVVSTAFLCNEKLVWSGLEQDDMRVLYKYVTTSLLPQCLESELQGVPGAGARNATTTAPVSDSSQAAGASHYGKFIVGPQSLADTSVAVKVPRVFVKSPDGGGDKLDECYLLVYRALSALICLVVDATDGPLTHDLYRNLDTFLGSRLTQLSSEIADRYMRNSPQPAATDFKYVYFNQMNLAQKSTIHSEHNRKVANVPPDILRLLSDIHVDMCQDPGDDTETIMKTESDCWVVGKKSDQREFFVVLNQKNANLTEIAEEVKRVCHQHFNNIFFLD